MHAIIKQGTNGTVPAPDARPSRNKPCPCGSGRKFKKCCMAVKADPDGVVVDRLTGIRRIPLVRAADRPQRS